MTRQSGKPGFTTEVAPGISSARQQYRLIHDIYVLLDDGDRRVLEAYGLNSSQFALLMLLDDKDEDGQRLTTLSRRLLRAKSTITRIVDQLEAGGWIVRIMDPEDRRAQRISLTPDGAQRREEVAASHIVSLEQRLNILDEEERESLRYLLSKLRKGLQDSLNKAW
jgi:DNA-binding MarR family transcriptional regulator